MSESMIVIILQACVRQSYCLDEISTQTVAPAKIKRISDQTNAQIQETTRTNPRISHQANAASVSDLPISRVCIIASYFLLCFEKSLV